ncbi:MAG: nucleotidyltransferase domain-containing protein [Bacteroidales bacterium]|nr:nucleotidyltransferase domain-containing protein [Bacteroidales bacterium]
MDKAEAIEKIRRYRLLLKEHFDLDKVYLFGSYARGTQREDSDLDVAIIVNSLDRDYFSVTPLIWKLRRQIDDRIEPVLIEKGNDRGGFLDEIQRNGIEITE